MYEFSEAAFPKKLISFNPMQYVVWRGKKTEYELFADEDGEIENTPTIDHQQFLMLEDFLKKKDNPALLPMQIAYYTGLRIGEVCGLTWQDINLDEQYLTVRRSMRYNRQRHKTEIGATKRKKVRTVDFCDTLADILRKAKTEQHKNRFKYGELYHLNYYKEVKEKDRTYYEVYSLPRTEDVPDGYKEIAFVCLRPDGAYESPSTVSIMCRPAGTMSLNASFQLSVCMYARLFSSPCCTFLMFTMLSPFSLSNNFTIFLIHISSVSAFLHSKIHSPSEAAPPQLTSHPAFQLSCRKPHCQNRMSNTAYPSHNILQHPALAGKPEAHNDFPCTPHRLHSRYFHYNMSDNCDRF